jgi:hypothetical protein
MSHDYDPSWDYEIDERPDEVVIAFAERFLSEHAPLFRTLGLSAPTLHYVVDLDAEDHLAKYVSGTSSAPVIVVDAEAVLNAAGKFEVPLEVAVETTLLHEYGHAYLESTGQNEDMEPHDEERLVERFAKTYWKTRSMKRAIKVLRPAKR